MSIKLEEAIAKYNSKNKVKINKRDIAKKIKYKDYTLTSLQGYMSKMKKDDYDPIALSMVSQISHILKVSIESLID